MTALGHRFALDPTYKSLLLGTVGDAAMVVALSGPAPEGESFGLDAALEAVHLFEPASGDSLRRA